ncbi:tetratricopeptide repeat protein [Clostridium fermenticellae]|uniref:Tetratricopeptide repeat protein n=1 Tax=Clostridium fermenticellae TaxID=2068654 RepID=A0A386H2P6_9CLOT|nr:tetratricopeptide repeat protein [Clostridium fermenticellae]AYD39838.1 tetratricopeptide repeat protein [Clostridium fermenticellae]
MGKIKLFLNKRKFPILILVILALVIIGFGVYGYNKVQAYNNLITTANKYMDRDDYDKASALFEQSLKYKEDSSVEKNIKLAATLKKFKEIYDDGVKLASDKKYLGAIEKFKTIDKSGLKWYSNAQKEIKECKKQYIAQNMHLANDALKNNKYDDANKYLDDILKIDSNNEDAKNLKDSIDEAMNQKQENFKSEEEAKQVPQNNAEKANVKSNSNPINDKTNEYASKMREIDNKIYEIESQREGMYSGSEENRQALQRQIDLLKQKNDLIDQMQK